MPRLRPPDHRRIHVPRSLFKGPPGQALALLAAAGFTLSCADVDPAPVLDAVPASPPADRQSWDVRLQMRGPSTEVIIQAPYLSDHLEDRQTRADSGALVLLIDHAPATDAAIDTARIWASRLLVDHRAAVVSFAGDVRIEGPGLRLSTDSMRWDRGTDALVLPRRARMDLDAGEIRSATLSGTTALETWQARQVWASFRVDAAAQEQRVGLEGRRAVLRLRAGQVMARFDTVTSHWRGRRLQCLQADYDGEQDRIEFLGAVSARDSGRVLRADTVRLDLRADRLTAIGGVVLEEEEGRLTAARLVDDAEGWRAAGTPARLQGEARRLTAPRMRRSAGDDWLWAEGGVEVEEGDSRRLQAADLRLDAEEDELFARHVRLEAQELAGRLRAGWLRSWQGGARVELGDSPRLERRRDDGTVLVLRADTLGIDMDARRLDGRGRFELLSPPHLRMTAAAGALDAGADSLHLTGGTRLALQTDIVDLRLEAGSAQIDLAAGQARRVRWPTDLEGRMEDAGQTTWIRAGRGELQLRQGRLDSLHLAGMPQVTHRGRGDDRASRFSATEMKLLFAADGTLRQLEARGSATALSRIADEDGQVAVNEVKGARLRIDLRDGAVVAVHLLEEIEGRYLPPPEEERQGSTP